MIYFSFTGRDDEAPEMEVLDAVDPEAALTEARERLHTHPQASHAHVFDGDQFVGTVEAPAFGFAGVNATTATEAPLETGRSTPEPQPGDVRI
jgi:hypothetical protein